MNEQQIKYSNSNLLACAMLWHLNNVDEHGEQTTNMGIPNGVFEVWAQKLKQMPTGILMTEAQALEIVRKK